MLLIVASVFPALLGLCEVTGSTVNPVIETKTGKVQGTYLETEVSEFYAFFGIPYAKPPLGDLRFKPPQEVEPWTWTHDGTTTAPACIQNRSVEQSEDCLVLNVYTDDITARNRSVLVYLHGGALEHGSGNFSLFGPHFLVKKDLVVVTMNFRLGIWGYLNLDLAEAPGNVGLMDAVLALKWIRENIEYFGGNPEAITIEGQSSGGVMVHSLLISPMSQGLFKQVIIESGNVLSYRLYDGNHTQVNSQILDQLNSSYTNEELLQHLKSLEPEQLLEIQINLMKLIPPGCSEYYPFRITKQKVFEGQESFFIQSPLEIIESKEYNQLPMIVGFNSDEGIILEEYIDILDQVNDNFELVVPRDLYSFEDHSLSKLRLADEIKEFYFGNQNLSKTTFGQYVKLGSDTFYIHITDYVVRLQSVLEYRSPIYYYEFAVDGAYNTKITSNYTFPGASHSDENGYIWYLASLSHIKAHDNYSDLTRHRMVDLWSNFVKYGNPTPEATDIIPLTWPTVDYPNVNSFLINRTLTLQQSPLRERTRFWQEKYGYELI